MGRGWQLTKGQEPEIIRIGPEITVCISRIRGKEVVSIQAPPAIKISRQKKKACNSPAGRNNNCSAVD